MEDICEKLLKEVERSYGETGKLSDDLLSALNCLFHGTLLSALELVDKSSVTKMTSPSGRTVFQVIGASGAPYLCLPNLNYCSCPAYNFSVLKKEEHLMCKHVLAMRLSQAMNRCKKLDVTNEEITSMILSLD
ncbi:zinc finger SWIM domain-containing protein 7-like [Biomphalaria glabrata]|uniref:Zinc finger SWIM domain-containing protein 7-like n=1 Tax=Biomphalaria glabrata TaxID=6526 RepID=A0A9W2YFZ3_BIOGL|nr:zinc finger SWIM domain-containing protein 7-like [Biomphalaria glabrata]XP_055861652.1 zinc finger SWIM domain-containing protein 7-like [Biomphalaria glabrata]KAI8739984.1 zinc finger SWIM domain-containing protein 7 [Biomphalaria glabrata]